MRSVWQCIKASRTCSSNQTVWTCLWTTSGQVLRSWKPPQNGWYKKSKSRSRPSHQGLLSRWSPHLSSSAQSSLRHWIRFTRRITSQPSNRLLRKPLTCSWSSLPPHRSCSTYSLSSWGCPRGNLWVKVSKGWDSLISYWWRRSRCSSSSKGSMKLSIRTNRLTLHISNSWCSSPSMMYRSHTVKPSSGALSAS